MAWIQSQDPHGGRQEPSPESCLLSSTHTPWHEWALSLLGLDLSLSLLPPSPLFTLLSPYPLLSMISKCNTNKQTLPIQAFGLIGFLFQKSLNLIKPQFLLINNFNCIPVWSSRKPRPPPKKKAGRHSLPERRDTQLRSVCKWVQLTFYYPSASAADFMVCSVNIDQPLKYFSFATVNETFCQ